jgi:ribose transport system permease protein
MKKLAGLLIFVVTLYVLVFVKVEPDLRGTSNINMLRSGSQLGIVCLGVGVLIISGGIDLSIGSFVALSGTVLAVGLQKGWSPAAAIGACAALGVLAGTTHGLIVTKLNVQPFVVTLCGLFVYRGLARWYSDEMNSGLGGKHEDFVQMFHKAEWFGLPVEFYYLLAALAGFAILLHRSVYGRYLFAIGSNETAARYAGIRVDRYKIVAYVVCSLSAVFYSILLLAKSQQIAPSNTGSLVELYAIAGAVIGGCSLRGGDGNAMGIVLGAAVLTMLAPAVDLWFDKASLEWVVIGLALLAGAILDEQLRARGLKALKK